MQHEAYGGGELSAGDHDRKLALDTVSLDGRCRIKRTPKSFASLHFQLVEGNLDHDWPVGQDSHSMCNRLAGGQARNHADVLRAEYGFYPARADTSEKAHLGPGGVSWQSEGSTARSLNVRRSG